MYTIYISREPMKGLKPQINMCEKHIVCGEASDHKS